MESNELQWIILLRRQKDNYACVSELVSLFTPVNLQPYPYVHGMTLNQGQSILKTLFHLAIASCAL